MRQDKREMTSDIFEQWIREDKTLREIAFACTCSDRSHNFSHYETITYPVRYKVTKEQIEKAKDIYKQRREEKIASLGNKLVFVGMGGTFEPKEGYIGNHRIRTEIVRQDGRRFFLEIGTAYSDSSKFRIDHSIDRDRQDLYESKAQELREQLENREFIHPTDRYKKYQSWMRQPYHWFRKKYTDGLGEGVYSEKRVIKFVNNLFGCNFKEMEVDNYLLNCDDYQSKSPKK